VRVGAEFTWQKLFHIADKDLVFSNLMAWEQAIALASPTDEGCVSGRSNVSLCLRAIGCGDFRDIGLGDLKQIFPDLRLEPTIDLGLHVPGDGALDETALDVFGRLPAIDADPFLDQF